MMIAASDPVTAVLLQYGAVGVIAVMALAAVRVLFNRVSAQTDRERERADRLEEELRKLNEAIRTEYVTTLATAAHAIQDANRAVADALAAVRRS
jgi:dihydrodipicolinate synthase/N-acetylneuraminate lyase